MTGRPSIRRAGPGDLAILAPLFDAYRQFYTQPPDLAAAHAFLADRLARGESVIFFAQGPTPAERSTRAEGSTPAERSTPAGTSAAAAVGLGFVQLYPSFSSVAAAPILILSDLFVSSAARGQGLARALMEQARAHAVETGARRLVLQTAEDNRAAQRLYESLGYRRDTVFRTYELEVPA